MSLAIGLLIAICGTALGLVNAYHADPVKAPWNGWSHDGDAVSEVITCNFDELDSTIGGYVELFVGFHGPGGAYSLTVTDYISGRLVASQTGVPPGRDHAWLRFGSITMEPGRAFTKGRQYEFRFTRSGQDSIHYYHRNDDPYPYEHMQVGAAIVRDKDLCCRVYGRLNAVDSTYWGTTSLMPWDTALVRQWVDRLRSSGAQWGTTYQQWQIAESLDGVYSFSINTLIRNIDSAGMEPVLVLFGTPKWASTRIQTYWVKDTTGTDSTLMTDTSVYCAPRNLWPASGETNYWVRYLDTLLSHRDTDSTRPIDLVHTWSIWNESNEGCTLYLPPQGYPGYTGWWRRPNFRYNASSGVRDMCSLYVRLCSLAEATIRSHAGHKNDRIVIGELGRVNHADERIRLVPGKEWLRAFYDIALPDSNHKPFWSIVSAHPYQTDGQFFDPKACEADAETLRAIMREYGDTAELWSTEFDYGIRSTVTAEQNANSLGAAYTSILAQAGLPGGTYDRACWWASCVSDYSGTWGLMNPDMSPNPSYYAYRQLTHALPGKRFNRRMMDGDTAVDNYVRMYEFEEVSGKRTWVCWRNGEAEQSIDVKLPVRADGLVGESLAYSSRTPKFSPETSDDEWLRLDLDERPVFITEIADPSRPDLRVDSVRYKQGEGVVRAWVTNHGSAPTPLRSGRRAHPTMGVLKADGDSVAQAVWTKSIGINQGAEFGFELGRTELPDTVLLRVTVNPDQTYVELGTDDNTGYTLVAKP